MVFSPGLRVNPSQESPPITLHTALMRSSVWPIQDSYCDTRTRGFDHSVMRHRPGTGHRDVVDYDFEVQLMISEVGAA